MPERVEGDTRPPGLLGCRVLLRLHSFHLLVGYHWQQMTSPAHRFNLRVNISASDDPAAVARSPQYSVLETLTLWLPSEVINLPGSILRAFNRGFECDVSPLHLKNTPKRVLSTLSRQRGVSRRIRL